MHINARSLLNCFDEVKLLILKNEVDILCVSETWLSSDMPDRFVSIGGFNIFRTDNGRASGTCIYVRDNLFSTRLDFNLTPCEGVEETWVQVQCRKLPSFIIGVIYRHPNSSFETFRYVSDVFHKALSKGKTLFILGDLNDDLLGGYGKLSEIINNHGLNQVIDGPTRVTERSKTLLDVLITNNDSIIMTHDVFKAHISDHDIIRATINLSRPKKEPVIKTFRSLRNYSKEIFCNNLLSNVPILNTMASTDDVNYQADTLTAVFNECLDDCAPIVTKEIRRPPAPWITQEIREAMEKRDVLRDIRDTQCTQQSNENYRRSKNYAKHMMESSKYEHFHKKFVENKERGGNIWNVMGEIIPSRRNDKLGCSFENVEEMAENFNEYFSNVGRNVFLETQQYRELNENEQNIVLEFGNRYGNEINFRLQPVHPDQIAFIITKMKNKNSHGSDGMTTRFLKDSLSILNFYISVIVNTSIVTHAVPRNWKHALVCPLYKQGDPTVPSNFRPVSLLPILSKVLEKVVALQLYDYLDKNNLFSNSQHGFRKKLSTETALNVIMEDVFDNVDKNKITLLTLCDLSKAFDSVSHKILLKKLELLHIDKSWFENYLSERTQSVKIKGYISNKKNIEYGVPQGSILGPLLFNIFVNDLQKVLKNCRLVQYADDSQFHISGKTNELVDMVDKCERNLKIVMDYFATNGLKLNGDKTNIIFIGSRQNISRIPDDLSIQIGSSLIVPSKTIRNLGITIDQFLSFDHHIRNMCSKANGILYFLNKNKEYLNRESKKIIVESLINSILSYCSNIWSVCGKTSLGKLQKVQNFAAKVAVGRGRKYDHATPFINELGWLRIEEKVRYDVGMYVFRILEEEIPNWVTNFRPVSALIGRQTRQSNHLIVPRKRTKIAEQAMSVRGARLWNSLPVDLKAIHVKSRFKKQLFSYIKENRNHHE